MFLRENLRENWKSEFVFSLMRKIFILLMFYVRRKKSRSQQRWYFKMRDVYAGRQVAHDKFVNFISLILAVAAAKLTCRCDQVYGVWKFTKLSFSFTKITRREIFVTLEYDDHRMQESEIRRWKQERNVIKRRKSLEAVSWKFSSIENHLDAGYLTKFYLLIFIKMEIWAFFKLFFVKIALSFAWWIAILFLISYIFRWK